MKKERLDRIIARGEVSGHSHIITGECNIERKDNEVIIHAGKNCAIKHLMEVIFIEEGIEQWTGEHKDIQLVDGESYKYVQQVEYNPYENEIEKVKD